MAKPKEQKNQAPKPAKTEDPKPVEVKVEKPAPTQTHQMIAIKSTRQVRAKSGQPSTSKDVYTPFAIVLTAVAMVVCKALNETRKLAKGSYAVRELPVYENVDQVTAENEDKARKQAEKQGAKIAKKLTQEQKEAIANLPQDELRKLLGLDTEAAPEPEAAAEAEAPKDAA